jgi:outer membrane lipoprotein-sorting protein
MKSSLRLGLIAVALATSTSSAILNCNLQNSALALTANESWTAASRSSTQVVIQKPGSNMKDGRPMIENMIKAAESYSDYVFEFEMTAYKSGTVIEHGKFYFKKPHLLRLEEMGPFRKGSVAVLTASGNAKGHSGGGLSFFVVDLNPRSSLLRSANGYPMVDSDLASLAHALKMFVEEGKIALVAENQTTLANGNKVEMLEVYMSDDGPIYKKVAVDPKTLLPVEWWDYENGKLVSHSTWDKFQGNLGLSDETFTIKGAAK